MFAALFLLVAHSFFRQTSGTRWAFVAFWAELLCEYNEVLHFLREMPVFNSQEFLRRFAATDARPFLSKVFDTQSWEGFLERHMEAENAPFHRLVANLVAARAGGGRGGGTAARAAAQRVLDDGAASAKPPKKNRRRLLQRRVSTELSIMAAPIVDSEQHERDLLASRYGVPEPSETVFDAGARARSSASNSSKSSSSNSSSSSAAPSTAGAATRRSGSVSPNAATARRSLGGRAARGGEWGGPGARTSRSSSPRRRVVNFSVPPPACRIPFAFEQRKRDSLDDVAHIASSFAAGVVDAALHRSSVALVATGSLAMSSSASGSAVRSAAPPPSRRASLNETVERTLRRRDLSCPPASLLAPGEVTPRAEAQLGELAEGSDGDGAALAAVGGARAPPAQAAAREWARDEIAGCVG